MFFKNTFVRNHPDLFVYLPAEQIHPHDHLLDRSILRFLPHWITPNMVTAFRLLTTPVVVALLLYDQYHIGIVAFLLVAFTDAIDGSLARTRHQITRFGILFDPLADKLLIGSILLIVVFRYFPVWLGVGVIGIEILFIMVALTAKVNFKTVRMANIWGKIKMLLQVLAVFLTLLSLSIGSPLLLTVATWLFGLAIGFAVVSLFAHGI